MIPIYPKYIPYYTTVVSIFFSIFPIILIVLMPWNNLQSSLKLQGVELQPRQIMASMEQESVEVTVEFCNVVLDASASTGSLVTVEV